MQNIKKVNTPLYKLILPWKIKFDTFSIKQAIKSKHGIIDNSGYITIGFHNFNDMSEFQNFFLDTVFLYQKNDMSLMVVKDDCTSNLSMILNARISDVYHDKFEIELYFDFYAYIENPQEATPYIRDIKINQLLD